MTEYQESQESQEEEEAEEVEEAEETAETETSEAVEESSKKEESSEQTEEPLNVMKISELSPFERNLHVTFVVIEKGESRNIVSKKTNEEHSLADIKVGDETGCIICTLWDETIDRVSEGESYTIKKGYVNVFQGQMRLALGKWGTLEDAEKTIQVDDVDMDNDRSKEQHEDRRRRRRFNRGGGGYGRSSYGGGRSRNRSSGYRGRSDRQERQERW
jgi:replication factor A1